MTDNVQSQNVDFTEGIKNTEAKTFKETKVMDFPTQLAIVEINKNYNKMVNNMFNVCAKMCIKTFNQQSLSTQEKTCAENCQKKFFESFVIGKKIVNNIVKEVEKVDLFDDKSEVDIVKSAREKKMI